MTNDASAIDRAAALRVVRALRTGSAPAELAREMFVGQGAWLRAAVAGLEETELCSDFQVRFVRARYGGGKTHFLRCLQAEALKREWATAYVLLRPDEVELDRFHTLVAEVARQIELPDGRRGIQALLRAALGAIANRSGLDSNAVRSVAAMQRLRAAVANLCREEGVPYSMKVALDAAVDAWLDREDGVLDLVGNWLGGGQDRLSLESTTSKSGGGAFKPRRAAELKPLGLGDADQWMRLIALLVRSAGLRGLMLALDEVELISGLRPNRRQNAFQTLRTLVDQSDPRTSPPATALYLAATPQMFEDRSMFPSYKALQDRIEVLPSVSGTGRINYRAPVIDLDRTELGRVELLELARNVVALHGRAHPGSHAPLDSDVAAIADGIISGGYVIARPRLMCRMLLDLLDGEPLRDLRGALAQHAESLQREREAQIAAQGAA